MVKVIVRPNNDKNCWYIDEVSDFGVSAGKICYDTKEKAATIAHLRHPYVDIRIED